MNGCVPFVRLAPDPVLFRDGLQALGPGIDAPENLMAKAGDAALCGTQFGDEGRGVRIGVKPDAFQAATPSAMKRPVSSGETANSPLDAPGLLVSGIM